MRIVNQSVGFFFFPCAYGICAKFIDGLRRQSQMSHDGNPCTQNAGNRLQNFFSSLQLHGIGGAEAAAKSMNLPFLGRVPLDMAIRKSSDAGVPPASGEGLIADAFGSIAARISTWIDNRFGKAG